MPMLDRPGDGISEVRVEGKLNVDHACWPNPDSSAQQQSLGRALIRNLQSTARFFLHTYNVSAQS